MLDRKYEMLILLFVLCGKHTNTAKGVAAELSITQEESKPYFLLCGRSDGNVTKPINAAYPLIKFINGHGIT